MLASVWCFCQPQRAAVEERKLFLGEKWLPFSCTLRLVWTVSILWLTGINGSISLFAGRSLPIDSQLRECGLYVSEATDSFSTADTLQRRQTCWCLSACLPPYPLSSAWPTSKLWVLSEVIYQGPPERRSPIFLTSLTTSGPWTTGGRLLRTEVSNYDNFYILLWPQIRTPG